MTRQVVKFATLLSCMSCDLCLFAVTIGKAFSDWSDLFGWQGRWRVALWVRSHCQEIWSFFPIRRKEHLGSLFVLQIFVVSKLVSHQEYCGPVLWVFQVGFVGKVQFPNCSIGGVVVPLWCSVCPLGGGTGQVT